MEDGDAVGILEAGDGVGDLGGGLVVALAPVVAAGDDEGGEEDLDVGALAGDVLVFGGVDAADDEVGDVVAEVVVVDGAELFCDLGDFGLEVGR